MKQSLLLSVLLLLLSSLSLVAPIHARNKANSPSPVAAPAPGPSHSDCTNVIYDMMSCLSYLTPGSNDTKPEKECCVGIQSVLEYNPVCICSGLKTSTEMGIPLNNTRALAMPTTCKIPIPAPHCGLAMGGASTPGASTSPGMSPGSPSSGTPVTTPSSAESPTSSPSMAESPAMTAPSPSKSGTNDLSVSTLTLVAVIVSFITCISAFSN